MTRMTVVHAASTLPAHTAKSSFMHAPDGDPKLERFQHIASNATKAAGKPAPAMSAEEHVKAIERFRGYLELDPTNPRLWINLGDMQHQSGNWAEAVESYKTSLRHFPD